MGGRGKLPLHICFKRPSRAIRRPESEKCRRCSLLSTLVAPGWWLLAALPPVRWGVPQGTTWATFKAQLSHIMSLIFVDAARKCRHHRQLLRLSITVNGFGL